MAIRQMQKVVALCKQRSGQTAVEWLMLMAAVAMTAYIMVSGPVANFTQEFITGLRSGIQTMVQHAEWTDRNIPVNDDQHPGSPNRLQPLHL